MATKRKMVTQALSPLDRLADGDPLYAIALMLWKNRLRQPDLCVELNEHDIKGFEDCVGYLKVRWVVKIHRPAGVPAQEAVAASPGRRAVPARAASGPKPFVMVQLVDDRGDAFRPVENNEQDFDRAAAASKVRRAQENAHSLAQRILDGARTGETSLSDVMDAAEALQLLASAV